MAVRDIKLRSRLSRNIHLIFSPFRSLSIRRSACVNFFSLGSENQSTNIDVCTIYRPPYWRTEEFLQHGGSILSYIILRRTSAHTSNLEKCLLYLSSTISQFLDFIHCMVFDFIFCCVTKHMLYNELQNQHISFCYTP